MYLDFVNYLILPFYTCILLNSLCRCHWCSSCHFRCWDDTCGHAQARCAYLWHAVMCFNLITFCQLFYMFSCIIDAATRLPFFFYRWMHWNWPCGGILLKLKATIFPVIYFLKMCYLHLGCLYGSTKVHVLFIDFNNYIL